MPKEKGEQAVFKRFWIRGSEDTKRALAHLAIDLGTSAEKLAGMILADVVSKVGRDPEKLRHLMPNKRE